MTRLKGHFQNCSGQLCPTANQPWCKVSPLLPGAREPELQLQQTPCKQLNYAQPLPSGDSPLHTEGSSLIS